MPGLDCDGNGVLDACEIGLDPSLDSTGEGTLDRCRYSVGDFDLNDLVDAADLGVLLALWGMKSPEIADLDGDGLVDAADLALLLGNWGPSSFPPTISAILPASGGVQGGETITITGLRLSWVLRVTVGGMDATQIEALDDTTVVATLPPGAALGFVPIEVTTRFGTAMLPRAFEYVFAPLPWAVVLQQAPDPAVVTNAALRSAIVATGLPWRVRDIASQLEMLLVPPGTFSMGCSPSLQFDCISTELPVHEVTLTQAFYLSRTPVTQAQWTAVMGSNPSLYAGFEDSPTRPVERVSWSTVQMFNAVTGLRLPTEAEWEYACRAGTTTAYNNGSNDEATLGALAWFGANSGGQTRPVGQKAPNSLGFHDMHGNVWEWVNDWFGWNYYFQSPGIDPPGPPSGTVRVVRGGGWDVNAGFSRSSTRGTYSPTASAENKGFRPARTP